jgi:hypothetical protein
MEIAKAFYRTGQPALPATLAALLDTVPSLAGFEATEVRPEFLTPLPPKGSSGPRHHDVWIRGRANGQTVGIGIEAKADERFSQSLAEQLSGASARSDIPERLDLLGSMLFGPTFDVLNESYAQLGSQLLTGLAGTAIQAALDGANMAAFIVYEFSSAKTDSRKHAKNADRLNAFVRALPGGFTRLEPSTTIGPIPISVSAADVIVPVYLGKVSEAV